MDTINNIELKDESIFPDENVLKPILGDSYTYYLELLKLFDHYDLHSEWRYYHDGKAWLCKVQLKKKTIVWMSAWKGYMQATVYLPLRLFEDLLQLDIERVYKNRMEETENVGKSKPCIFEIRSKEEILNFEKVMNFKIHAK